MCAERVGDGGGDGGGGWRTYVGVEDFLNLRTAGVFRGDRHCGQLWGGVGW